MLDGIKGLKFILMTFRVNFMHKKILPLKTLRVIKKLSLLLNNKMCWSITGSVGLALQGVEVYPQDIDIITDKNGAYIISNILREYTIRNISYSTEDNIRSYFCIFTIDDLKIEVMGDVENFLSNGKWEEHINWKDNIEFIKISKGFLIPVLSLKYEISIYNKLQKCDKVELINQRIHQLDSV